MDLAWGGRGSKARNARAPQISALEAPEAWLSEWSVTHADSLGTINILL